jgi:hypothetical protein
MSSKTRSLPTATQAGRVQRDRRLRALRHLHIMESKKADGRQTHDSIWRLPSRSEEVPQRQMDRTCDYVRGEQISRFYICHDTDLPA